VKGKGSGIHREGKTFNENTFTMYVRVQNSGLILSKTAKKKLGEKKSNPGRPSGSYTNMRLTTISEERKKQWERKLRGEKRKSERVTPEEGD